MAIPGIGAGLPSIGAAATQPPGGATPGAGGTGGGTAFGQLLDGLTHASTTAGDAMNSVATGGNADLSDVTLSVQMESLAFDLAVQIRNRLVEAYQTVFQMQV